MLCMRRQFVLRAESKRRRRRRRRRSNNNNNNVHDDDDDDDNNKSALCMCMWKREQERQRVNLVFRIQNIYSLDVWDKETRNEKRERKKTTNWEESAKHLSTMRDNRIHFWIIAKTMCMLVVIKHAKHSYKVRSSHTQHQGTSYEGKKN